MNTKDEQATGIREGLTNLTRNTISDVNDLRRDMAGGYVADKVQIDNKAAFKKKYDESKGKLQLQIFIMLLIFSNVCIISFLVEVLRNPYDNHRTLLFDRRDKTETPTQIEISHGPAPPTPDPVVDPSSDPPASEMLNELIFLI